MIHRSARYCRQEACSLAVSRDANLGDHRSGLRARAASRAPLSTSEIQACPQPAQSCRILNELLGSGADVLHLLPPFAFRCQPSHLTEMLR